MISIDVSEITAMVLNKEIEAMVVEELRDTTNAIFTDLVSSPPVGTPVDTGAARNSWQVDTSIPLAPEVYSMSPYIGALNDGHSKQSPEGFVDAVVDKHLAK